MWRPYFFHSFFLQKSYCVITVCSILCTMAFQEDIESGKPMTTMRRVRRTPAAYERLVPPPGVSPGEPIPSIEGWVLLLRHLPEVTQTVHLENIFSSFNPTDPEYFGAVKEVKISVDDYGNCSGWALVEVESREGFDRAIRELNGRRFDVEEGRVVPEGEPSSCAPVEVSPAFVAESEAIDAEDEEAAAPLRAPGAKRGRNEDANEEENESKRINVDV